MITPAVASSADGTASIPTTRGQRHPYLRDAAITCLPNLTDDQLDRIAAEVHTKCPFALTSRVSDSTVLIQGVAIKADSPLDADRIAWERMRLRVSEALSQPVDNNVRLASIAVSPAGGLN
jgi:hypothetical protein